MLVCDNCKCKIEPEELRFVLLNASDNENVPQNEWQLCSCECLNEFVAALEKTGITQKAKEALR